MGSKFSCSFPEFNFANLPLLVKGIEVKNCSVKYAVSLQIIALSRFGCIAQWRFVLTNKTAATTKPKLTSSRVKLTLPPPAPILCLCLLILEVTKTSRAEGKWNYLIYGHFLAFAEPRWKYTIKKKKQTNKNKCYRSQIMTLRCLCPKRVRWATSHVSRCESWGILAHWKQKQMSNSVKYKSKS